MQRLVSESNVLLNVNHFHITFTIDERLRRWFLVNRLALNDRVSGPDYQANLERSNAYKREWYIV